MSDDRRDYLAAFVIGALAGIGAAVLLSPPRSKKRLRPPLDAPTRRLRRRGRKLRKTLRGWR